MDYPCIWRASATKSPLVDAGGVRAAALAVSSGRLAGKLILDDPKASAGAGQSGGFTADYLN